MQETGSAFLSNGEKLTICKMWIKKSESAENKVGHIKTSGVLRLSLFFRLNERVSPLIRVFLWRHHKNQKRLSVFEAAGFEPAVSQKTETWLVFFHGYWLFY